MHRYKVYSHASPTTAAATDVSTGTAIKTVLQLATPATRQIQLISWGFSMDDLPGADSKIELIDTNVAATVTAHVAAGLPSLDPNSPASLMALGTASSGYNASAEGSITSARLLDSIAFGSTSGENIPLYIYQFMPDERPVVNASRFLRVRATTPTGGVELKAWICWDE